VKVLFLDIDGVSPLAVISEPWMDRGRQRVRVRCECGNEFAVRVNSLKTGNTTSCGCKRKRSLVERNSTHGMAARSGRHPLYKTWADIIQRCTNTKHPKYADYGGRGIAVCARWAESFAAFVADVGSRPFPRAEIDRKDNDRGYEPDNVRWATRSQQMRNTRVNRVVSHNGQTMLLADWAALLGWSYMGLKDRVRRLPLVMALVPKRRTP
jgi:hypothetical protein